MITLTQIPLSVIIITSRSGAGKSTALHVFEDLKFITADGVPPCLIIDMIQTIRNSSLEHIQGIALGIDQRRSGVTSELEQIFHKIDRRDIHFTLLYLETDTATLIRRYATTRRPHPLERENIGLEQALEEEEKQLIPIKKISDFIIDTTDYSIHDLRRVLQKRWNPSPKNHRSLRVNIISFGFKYGVPKEADMVFDLRFLPNPYFIEELRPLSGLHRQVASYVLKNPIGNKVKKRLLSFLMFLLPLYDNEGRYRLTIALGCTGGKHRSVTIAEAIFNSLIQQNYTVSIEHRHMELG